MSYRLQVVLLLLSLFNAAAPGQPPPLTLTLDESIALALGESYGAQTLRLTLERAEESMREARGRVLPQVSLSLQAPNFDERVTEIRLPDQLPTYNTTGTLAWGSTFSISQALPTNGSLSFTSYFNQDRQSVFLEAADTTSKTKRVRSEIAVQFTQPVLRPNTVRLNLERARLRLERAQRSDRSGRLDLVYDVTQAFYSYYSALQNLDIARQEMENQQTSYDLAQRKYEAGLIPEVQALEMEVGLAQSRSRLLAAESAHLQRKDAFLLAVGLDLDREVDLEVNLTHTDVGIDETFAVKHGLQHRTDLRSGEIDRRLSEIQVEVIDAQTSISGDFRAYYNRTGISDPSLSYDTGTGSLFESSWENLKQRPRNIGVSFILTIPIWDSGVNGAEVAAARAALRQEDVRLARMRDQAVLDIRSAVRRVHQARSSLEVLEKSQTVAQRSYDISLARFENGDITAQELANSRDSLTQTRQSTLRSFIDYRLALADLKRQTLYDFEEDRSLVEDPVQ